MRWLRAAFWAGTVLAVTSGRASDSPVNFGETTVLPNVAVQGASVAVNIPFECEPGWRYLAYRVAVYRPYAPTACAEESPWPLSESEHGREWDSYTIRKWTWYSRSLPQPAQLEFSLDTTGWPTGDYRLHVSFLFRNEALSTEQEAGKRDRYLQRPVLLSVLDPVRTQDPQTD
jgi:hypothetical protein